MHREPDVGFDPGSPGSRPGQKQALNRCATQGSPLGMFYSLSRASLVVEPLLSWHCHPLTHRRVTRSLVSGVLLPEAFMGPALHPGLWGVAPLRPAWATEELYGNSLTWETWAPILSLSHICRDLRPVGSPPERPLSPPSGGPEAVGRWAEPKLLPPTPGSKVWSPSLPSI